MIGSIGIAAGSLGVGWLGPASVLHSWPLVDTIRNARMAEVLCALAVIIGALLLLAAWISLGLSLLRRRGEPAPEATGATKRVVTAAIAWTVPLIVALPLFSRDMYAYVGQGRLMVAGSNPYLTGVADIPGWYGIGVDPLWADTSTPYGPLFLWFEKMVVTATSGFPTEIAVLLFRLLAVAGLAMMAYYAWRIARLRGYNEAAVLWFIAASPLVLMNFVAAGHNDSLMLGFIIAGVYYAMRNRPVLGTVLVAAAIGVKPIALIALPIIGLIWAGQQASWGVVIRRWIAVAAIGVGSVLVLGWVLGVGAGWIIGLATPTAVSNWYAPANIIGLTLGGFAPLVHIDGGITQTVVKLLFMAAGAGFATWLLVKRRHLDPLLLLFGCFAAIVLTSATIHPWYGIWLMTLLVLTGIRRAWTVRTIVYPTVFFMLIGLAEPFNLIMRLENDPLLTVLPRAVAFLGVVGIMIHAELVTRRQYAFDRPVRLPAPARTQYI